MALLELCVHKLLERGNGVSRKCREREEIIGRKSGDMILNEGGTEEAPQIILPCVGVSAH